jgi:hypothetical protein
MLPPLLPAAQPSRDFAQQLGSYTLRALVGGTLVWSPPLFHDGCYAPLACNPKSLQVYQVLMLVPCGIGLSMVKVERNHVM